MGSLSALKGLNGESGNVTLVYGLGADLERGGNLSPRPTGRTSRRDLVLLTDLQHILQSQHADAAEFGILVSGQPN
jgi:hypothetical protein